jgi:hypothetical protein
VPTNTPVATNTPTNTPTRTPTPTPTNTPTPTPVIGQCLNIKLYKNNVVVIPTTLQPGDTIVIAVVGTNATQARIQINNETTWRVSTTKNASGEWIFNYTIPTTGVTSLKIQGELFIGGVWQ